jgi:hypothetical protein
MADIRRLSATFMICSDVSSYSFCAAGAGLAIHRWQSAINEANGPPVYGDSASIRRW